MNPIVVASRMWLTRSLKPFHFKNEYDEKLEYQEAQGLGIYVHIPFCKSLCSFCPYCKVKYEEKLSNRYLEALIKEIEMVGKENKQRKEVTTVYFGGGTPGLVAPRIKEIIQVIERYFKVTEGIGIELHPSNVTPELLQCLKEAGITKISIGIQSFQEEFLHILGRQKVDYNKMFEALKTVSFETVSMDFIFALPNQTFEHLKKDIETAFQNGANHIAIYPFIDFTFAKADIPTLNRKEKRTLLDKITHYCLEKGYVRDSIWTFSKEEGKKYSSMTRDYFIGLGCSATTLLHEQFKINTFSVEAYIERINAKKLPTALTIRFTKRQRMIYYLFWTAYTTRVNEEAFKKFFGVSLKSQYGMELFIAKRLGLITYKNGTYELTLKGAFEYHYYENYYTLAYIDKMWGILKDNPFPKEIKL